MSSENGFLCHSEAIIWKRTCSFERKSLCLSKWWEDDRLCLNSSVILVLLLPLILFCFVQFCMILLNLLNHLLFIVQNHSTFAQGRIIIIYCKWSISNAKRICFKLKSVYFCDVQRRAPELDQSLFMFNEIYFISVNGSVRMWFASGDFLTII